MTDPDNNQKDNGSRAVAVGFLLIVAVFAVTLGRYFWPEDTPLDPSDQQQSADQKISQERKMEMGSLSVLLGKKDLEVWDLRDAESFEADHIIDSKNISPEDMDAAISRIQPGKKYVLVDDMGDISSALISTTFRSDDYKDVFYLAGGFAEWKSNYGPTISAGDPYSLADQAKVTYIRSDDLKNIIDSDRSLYIIDVRKAQSFEGGHLKNAVNIFLDDLERRRHEIPAGKKIVLYDNDGLWAFQGAVRLADAGIFNVHPLSDGLDAWREKGYEIVK